MTLEKSQRKGGRGESLPTQKLPWEGAGQSRPDSLLSDDVLPGQGCAGHPSHLHVMGDLGEVQAQVHAMDGHSSPSFGWSRHCQNLWEGNGISKPAVHGSRNSSPLCLPEGGTGTLMDIWNLGQQTVFSLLCSLSRILAAYFFIPLPQVFRSLTHPFIPLLNRNQKVPDSRNETIVSNVSLNSAAA